MLEASFDVVPTRMLEASFDVPVTHLRPVCAGIMLQKRIVFLVKSVTKEKRIGKMQSTKDTAQPEHGRHH
jgi:hypothetical protein